MINRILHSWSVNMKFMKLVVRYFARFINFILNDHSSIFVDRALSREVLTQVLTALTHTS